MAPSDACFRIAVPEPLLGVEEDKKQRGAQPERDAKGAREHSHGFQHRALRLAVWDSSPRRGAQRHVGGRAGHALRRQCASGLGGGQLVSVHAGERGVEYRVLGFFDGRIGIVDRERGIFFGALGLPLS